MDEQTSRIAAQLLRSALAHFEAERQSALATLDVYLHRPSAESATHLVEEIVKTTKCLASAESAIEAIERNFLASTPPNTEHIVPTNTELDDE